MSNDTTIETDEEAMVNEPVDTEDGVNKEPTTEGGGGHRGGNNDEQ